MTVRSVESAPGVRVLVFTCDGCGAPASFGRGVNIRAALATTDVKLAGEWTCGPEGCARKGRAA